MRRLIPVIIFTAVLVSFTAPAQADRDRHRDNWSVNFGWNSWNDSGFVNVHYNNFGHHPGHWGGSASWHRPVYYSQPAYYYQQTYVHTPVYRPPVWCAPVRPAPVYYNHSTFYGW